MTQKNEGEKNGRNEDCHNVNSRSEAGIQPRLMGGAGNASRGSGGGATTSGQRTLRVEHIRTRRLVFYSDYVLYIYIIMDNYIFRKSYMQIANDIGKTNKNYI